MQTRTIHNLEELDTFVDDVIEALPRKKSANIITLSGDLGAGKTTFTQLLGKKLGIDEPIVSPTFMIMRSYKANAREFKKLVHIDAYRIEDDSEIEVLHIPELFHERDSVVCIEWPERMSKFIPDDAYKIFFMIEKDDVRTITYGI